MKELEEKIVSPDKKAAYELIINLTQMKSSAPILESIIVNNGESMLDPKLIAAEVIKFYTQLYTDPMGPIDP